MRGREQCRLQSGQCPLGCDRGPRATPCPQGLQAVTLSTSAIRVSWEPPTSNGDVIGYVLHLQPVGGGCGWLDRSPWT